MKNNLSKNLQSLRKQYGLTAKSLVEKLGGVKLCQYYAWESGQNEPNIKNLLKLAEYYSISLDDLIFNLNK